MHSSLFSSLPVFTEGGRYWFAQLIRTAGAIYTSNTYLMQFGMYQGATDPALRTTRRCRLVGNESTTRGIHSWASTR